MDDNIMMRQKSRENKIHLQKMKRLFAAVAIEGDDKIFPEELSRILEDKDVRAWFSAQGLPTTDGDADRLFTLLDKDKDGYLTKEELTSGVATLKGNARSIDVRVIMKEIDDIKSSERRRLACL